jgi:hypothetical protein
MLLSFDSAVPLLGMYHPNLFAHIQKDAMHKGIY